MTLPPDLLLDPPLPEPWLRALLAFTFVLHLLFVLFTLGSAVMGVWWAWRAARHPEGPWGELREAVLRPFFVHKSVAIVLGIGPLLLVQAVRSVPFLTATNLMAPFWLLLVLLLLAALVLIEPLVDGRHERRHRIGAAIGTACLLAVPAIFAAVVVTAENPGSWPSLVDRLTPRLTLHWALRVAHVLGAAVAFTAGAHLVVRPPRAPAATVLRTWLSGSLLVQVALGVALMASLPHRTGPRIGAVLLIGVLAAVALLAILRVPRPLGATAGVLLVVLLGSMLSTRQLLQDRVLAPFSAALAARAAAAERALAGYEPLALAAYHGRERSPRTPGLNVYGPSCGFCHGTVGNGAGESAPELVVPPEDLTRYRAGDAALLEVLREGVPGTGMPRFGIFTRWELEELIGFLRREIGLRAAPQRLRGVVPAAALHEAEAVYRAICADCHGVDGHPTAVARRFAPPPPDLTRRTVSASRAMEVITRGYPGTRMAAHGDLPEAVRWALVDRVHALYELPE